MKSEGFQKVSVRRDKQYTDLWCVQWSPRLTYAHDHGLTSKKKNPTPVKITRALKKFVQGNPGGKFKIFSGANGYYVAFEDASGYHGQPSSQGSRIGWDKRRAQRELREAQAELRRESRTNPKRVKGAKCNGGRAVSLRNFTGRVIRKRDGTVQILGRMQKTK